MLRLLEEGRPVDVILFSDTGLEFPQMYEHLNQLEQLFSMSIHLRERIRRWTVCGV